MRELKPRMNYPLGKAQLRILEFLQAGPASIPKVANELGMHPGTASAAMYGLLRAGRVTFTYTERKTTLWRRR